MRSASLWTFKKAIVRREVTAQVTAMTHRDQLALVVAFEYRDAEVIVRVDTKSNWLVNEGASFARAIIRHLLTNEATDGVQMIAGGVPRREHLRHALRRAVSTPGGGWVITNALTGAITTMIGP